MHSTHVMETQDFQFGLTDISPKGKPRYVYANMGRQEQLPGTRIVLKREKKER